MRDAAWIEGHFNAEGDRTYKKLNPTGRWKITRVALTERRMYVEHQGRFFKSWIDERDIVFAAES